MTSRALPVVLGLLLIAAAGIQGHAFMKASEDVPAPAGENEALVMVDRLRNEIAEGQFSCPVMRARLDSAINEIDRLLDSGVDDQRDHLAAREALVGLRRQLPCVSQRNGLDGATTIDDTIIGEQIIDDGTGFLVDGGMLDGGHSGYSGSGPGGGYGGGPGGVGGGSTGVGGGGGGGLLAAGAAAAIAIPLASSNGSAPGRQATR